MAVGIRPYLPFKGVHLLLGNDLAGDKVVVNPLLTSTPCVDQPPDPIEQEIPDLYPSCAVTRQISLLNVNAAGACGYDFVCDGRRLVRAYLRRKRGVI